MTVAVVTSAYGDFDRFLPEWEQHVSQLAPDEVIVIREIPDGWKHPQAGCLDAALRLVTSEWTWFVDADDLVLPDGLDDPVGDVWVTGYEDTDGVAYIPRLLPNLDYLALRRNPYPAGSMVRTEVALEVGGFDDVAFQDWAMWRKLAAADAVFGSSGRVNYRRRLHQWQRSRIELVPPRREEHYEEMVMCLHPSTSPLSSSQKAT